MSTVDPTYIHFLYHDVQGIRTACGVCNRHRCTEETTMVDLVDCCPNCKRLLTETDFLIQIKDEL
jgi:hypothetical protein